MPVDPVSMAGQAAVYKVIGSGAGMSVVREIMLVLIGMNPAGPDAGAWMQLQITKVDGHTLTATVLVDDPVLSRERAGRKVARRYLFQDGDERAIEYVNAVRGGAVVPQYGLFENLFPTFDEADVAQELFPPNGRFLGLTIERIRTEKSDAHVPDDPLRLMLDPELLIGTGRNVRDTQGGRIWTGDDYPYRALDRKDYDELIAAGMNYFVQTSEAQEAMLRDRPVFYLVERLPRYLEYPEMLYRANCRGMTMFLDEPAVYIMWFMNRWPGYVRALDHPVQITQWLDANIRASYDSDQYGGRRRLERYLRIAPFDLGTMRIDESHFPAWETFEWSAWYQLRAGLPGIVHEGRYYTGNEPQLTNAEFDVHIPCRPESIFLICNAFFRGAARAFDGDWGTAIYGQCEQAIAPLAMDTAYDMGARYVWFWTSDRRHHIPYAEQIELTRQLRAHADKHPRPPLDRLRKAAKVAIALPNGYNFGPFRVWDAEVFHLDQKNRAGVTYREVLAKAAEQLERCIKQDVAFDFVYDDARLAARIDDYDEIVFVSEDASLRGRRRGGARFDVPPPPRTDEERNARRPDLTIHAEPAEGKAPLTVTLSAEAKSYSGPLGIKHWSGESREPYYREITWIIEVGHEGKLIFGRADERPTFTFNSPGEYRIGAWTCDDHGVATRRWTTVRAK